MNLTRKTVTSVAVAGALLVGGAAAALAGTTEQSYSVTVAPFNGSGYTGYQTKSGTGTAGKVWTESVGGNYQVDARLNATGAAGGNGDWSRNLDDRTARDLYNRIRAGQSTRVQFSNKATTRVSVQVSGVWRSM